MKLEEQAVKKELIILQDKIKEKEITEKAVFILYIIIKINIYIYRYIYLFFIIKLGE